MYNPYYGSGPRFSPRRRFGTSPTELLHLGIATTVLIVAIVLWMQNTTAGSLHDLALAEQIFVAIGIAVTGFALHEIGHKITAQHFGHWSEFRFSLPGLLLTLLVSYFGFLFGAPGATWHTATSPRENGRISAAGPVVNIVIALAAWGLRSLVLSEGDPLRVIADGVLLFNTVLAGFNLVPLGALDGRKVLRWNPFLYAVLVATVVAIILLAHPFRFFLES